MKKTVVLMSLLFYMVGCAVFPAWLSDYKRVLLEQGSSSSIAPVELPFVDTNSVTDNPMVYIRVKLLYPATNLYSVYEGQNNALFIAGDLLDFASLQNTNAFLGSWDAFNVNSQMHFLTNDSDGLPIYEIVLVNKLKKQQPILYKFQNGSLNERGDWINMEVLANYFATKERSFNARSNKNVVVNDLGTNFIESSTLSVQPNGIQKWKAVLPTYFVTNVWIRLESEIVNQSPNGHFLNNYAIIGPSNVFSDSGMYHWGHIVLNNDYLVHSLNSNVLGLEIDNYNGIACIEMKTVAIISNDGGTNFWQWGKHQNILGIPRNWMNATNTNRWIEPSMWTNDPVE